MLNCEDVSKLVSESLDLKLPFWTRVRLWMHLCMCRLCRGFRRDLLHIHREVTQHAQDVEYDTGSTHVTLSDASRERMKRLLESRDR